MKNFPHYLVFVILNEVNHCNIFPVFFLYTWSSKVNRIFIIFRISFFLSKLNWLLLFFIISSKLLLLYSIKALVTGLPVTKFFMEYIYIVCFDCITTGSDNSDLTPPPKYRIRRCLVPLNDRHFAKLGGGLDKGDFYFINICIKNFEKKLESIKFLWFVMSILRIIQILI